MAPSFARTSRSKRAILPNSGHSRNPSPADPLRRKGKGPFGLVRNGRVPRLAIPQSAREREREDWTPLHYCATMKRVLGTPKNPHHCQPRLASLHSLSSRTHRLHRLQSQNYTPASPIYRTSLPANLRRPLPPPTAALGTIQ